MDDKRPELRFEGFDDAWEQRKLGEMVNIKSGNAPSEFSKGFQPYLKVDDLNNSTVFQETTKNTVSGSENKKALKKSIVFSKRGAAIMTNKVRILQKNMFMDTNMMALFPEKIDMYFLFITIAREELAKIADTSTIPQINNKHIEPYYITIPEIFEQQKIGQFFRTLDQLIDLQKRKVELLKKIKKGYLQQLFPIDNSEVPNLRFEGFSETWGKFNLGEVTDITKGVQRGKKELSAEKTFENPYPVYNGGQGVSGFTNEFNRENKIIVSEGGASAGFVNYYPGKYWSGGHNFTVDNLRNDLNFIHAILDSNQQSLYSLKVGSGLPNIQLGTIKGFKIIITKIEEQIKIGNFFHTFYHSIRIQNYKLDQLKKFDKAYLQKMFI